MISSRDDILMTILGCGEPELKLIDRVGLDWCDVLGNYQSNQARTFVSVMSSLFGLAKSIVDNEIKNRVDYLEDTENMYGISAEQKAELEALKELDPYEDIEEYIDSIDTQVSFVKNAEIYQKYLNNVLADFTCNTGFEIKRKELSK